MLISGDRIDFLAMQWLFLVMGGGGGGGGGAFFPFSFSCFSLHWLSRVLGESVVISGESVELFPLSSG